MEITEQQAADFAMRIMQNEGTTTLDVSDSEIAFYLEMWEVEASPENIEKVRNA